MKATKEVRVRYVPVDVAHRLESLAKQGGYKSLQTFLLATLTELSLEELQLDAQEKFIRILGDLGKTIENNTEALSKVDELYEIILETS